jgi:hypothetical protein
MRGFLILVVAVGLGVFFYKQKHSDDSATSSATAGSSPAKIAQTAAAATPPPVSQPAQSQAPSGPNWMKRSLDRARDVRDQSRAQTQDAQNP